MIHKWTEVLLFHLKTKLPQQNDKSKNSKKFKARDKLTKSLKTRQPFCPNLWKFTNQLTRFRWFWAALFPCREEKCLWIKSPVQHEWPGRLHTPKRPTQTNTIQNKKDTKTVEPYLLICCYLPCLLRWVEILSFCCWKTISRTPATTPLLLTVDCTWYFF